MSKNPTKGIPDEKTIRETLKNAGIRGFRKMAGYKPEISKSDSYFDWEFEVYGYYRPSWNRRFSMMKHTEGNTIVYCLRLKCTIPMCGQCVRDFELTINHLNYRYWSNPVCFEQHRNCEICYFCGGVCQ